MFFDLLDTWKVGKFRALYAGLVPTVLFTFLFTGTVYKTSRVIKASEEQNPEEMHDSQDSAASGPVNVQYSPEPMMVMPPDSTFDAYTK